MGYNRFPIILWIFKKVGLLYEKALQLSESV